MNQTLAQYRALAANRRYATRPARPVLRVIRLSGWMVAATLLAVCAAALVATGATP